MFALTSDSALRCPQQLYEPILTCHDRLTSAFETMQTSFKLTQNILPKHKDAITARSVHVNNLAERDLDSFLSSIVDGKVGLAPAYDAQQALAYLAFASRGEVLTVKLSSKNPNSEVSIQKRQLLETKIFMNPSLTKYAFHMDKLCTSLFCDLSFRIVKAVDILSGSVRDRHLLLTKIQLLGGETAVNKTSLGDLFREEESSKANESVVATQAWAAFQASLLLPASSTRFIDTTIFSDKVCLLFHLALY